MATEKYGALSMIAETPEEQAALQKVMASRKALEDALSARERQFFDPVLLAVAQGFLAPTKTGSFGESLANVAGMVGPAQAGEEKRASEIAQIRAELASQELGAARARRGQELLGKVYKTSPEGDISIDPEAALAYARATGDPKMFEFAAGAQQKQRLRTLGQQMFTQTEVEDEQGNKKTVSKFNPQAAQRLAALSDDPVGALTKYADMLPKLRKAGMLEGLGGDKSSPFDALVLMADALGPQGPAIKAQAQRLAEQYGKGLIDEDKANQLAQSMLSMANSSLDRQTAQANQQVMQSLMAGLRRESVDLQAEEAERRRRRDLEEDERKKREAEGKLTDEQKITFNKIVIPIQQEAAKAGPGLAQVTQLRNTIQNAPSGSFSGAYASSVGRLFGTDENTALRRLEALSKGLIPMIPRLPGAASNLDATNLEKSIGRLPDITLTNKQRRELVDEIEKGFTRLINRADAVQRSWESSKTVPVSVLGGEQPSARPPAAGAPAPATGAPTRAFIGTRAIVVRNNQWVYEDTGKPVER